eukprot:7242629-Karenia_brevis.AAC.1
MHLQRISTLKTKLLHHMDLCHTAMHHHRQYSLMHLQRLQTSRISIHKSGLSQGGLPQPAMQAHI